MTQLLTPDRYTFLDQNHTVTAGSPNQGCKPSGQFNSGFVPVAANANTKPTFSVAVTNTQPITVYCAQAQHCQVGMVMVINPAANVSHNHPLFTSSSNLVQGPTTLAAYTALCAKAKTNTPAKAVNGGVLKNANTAAAPAAPAAKAGKTGKGRAKGAAAAAAATAATGAAPAAKKKAGLAALFGRKVGPAVGAAVAAPCLNGTMANATNGTTTGPKGKKAGKKTAKKAGKKGKKAKKAKCAKTTLATVASLSVPSVSAIPLPSAVSAAATPSSN